LTISFTGQVLLVNGDSHVLQIDKRLADAAGTTHHEPHTGQDVRRRPERLGQCHRRRPRPERVHLPPARRRGQCTDLRRSPTAFVGCGWLASRPPCLVPGHSTAEGKPGRSWPVAAGAWRASGCLSRCRPRTG
jgi:hypothetical protein